MSTPTTGMMVDRYLRAKPLRIPVAADWFWVSAISRHPGQTFLFNQTMGLESYGIEELKVPECVRIANRREHVAEVALLRFHAIFLPEPSEGPLGVR